MARRWRERREAKLRALVIREISRSRLVLRVDGARLATLVETEQRKNARRN